MATTLPCLQMARSLSSLKTVVWSPILSAPNVKKKKKIMCIPRRAYYASLSVHLWKREKGCGYSRASWGWEYILLAYIPQPIFGNVWVYCSTWFSDGVHHMSQSVWHSWCSWLCDSVMLAATHTCTFVLILNLVVKCHFFRGIMCLCGVIHGY